MHKFLRAAGFSMYQKKKDIDQLMELLQSQSAQKNIVQLDDDTTICEIRAEAAPGIGVSVVGVVEEDGTFEREFYFPYLIGKEITSKADCSIQRHAERETYAGVVDENSVGISLIFYVQNFMEFRKKKMMKDSAFGISSVSMSGLSVGGKILLPVKKSAKQIQKAKVAAMDRNNLIEAAKKGDEEAMETLTIEDIDLYSQISKRAQKEDLYSIIDSCFMPCGIECDQYSIIGEILNVNKVTNTYTKEEIYQLDVECNDLKFAVAINSQDLMGEPAVGRRFKGQVWMQGNLNFKPYQFM